MKLNTSRLAALLLCGSLFSPLAIAQTPVEGPPTTIDYQGLVFDGGGAPLGDTEPTNYKMFFRIYGQAENGTPLWSEKQIVTVNNGQFSVRLGEGEALELAAGDPADELRPALDTVFDGSDRFLGVSVALVAGTNPTGEIVPRLAFLTAPFSFVSERAVMADSVIDGAIGASQIDSSFALWNTAGSDVYFDTGGNVGIGYDNPAAKLHIRGGSNIDNSGGGGFFTLGSETGNNLTIDGDEIQRYSGGTTPATLNLNARGGNIALGTIADDSRVGINHLYSPGVALNVREPSTGATNIARFETSTSAPVVRIQSAANSISLGDGNSGYLLLGATGSTNLVMDTNDIQVRNNGAAATLNLNREGGNVNVGTGAGTTRLHLNGTSSASTFNVKQNGTDNNLARFVTSGGTEIARVMKGDALTLGGGNTGHLILGENTGANLGMDTNDVQARNNGSAATLNLNDGGGNIGFGDGAKTSRFGFNGFWPGSTFNVRMVPGNSQIARFGDENNDPIFRISPSDVYVDGGADFDVVGGGAKNFLIDHPLDPKNKVLRHAAVEGPERMTIYHGTVTLDDAGKATAELPSYFEALNKEFHYQLTCVGGFANVYVAEEIDGNRFSIGGGHAGLKVCWQVTAVRDDASARAKPYVVEAPKDPEEAGKYLDPAAFSATASAQ